MPGFQSSGFAIACALLTALACGEEAAPPDGGAAGSGSSGTVTWCQALGVIESSCQRCHSDPPQNGAPFSLLAYEHTQALVGTPQVTVATKMRRAVATDFMPLQLIPLDPPVQPLTCEQKTTLLTWLDEGAQPVGGLECAVADKTLLPCDPVLGGGAGAGGM